MQYLIQNFEYILLLAALGVVIYSQLQIASKIDNNNHIWILNIEKKWAC